jgi:hypothetical protein
VLPGELDGQLRVVPCRLLESTPRGSSCAREREKIVPKILTYMSQPRHLSPPFSPKSASDALAPSPDSAPCLSHDG